MTHKLPAPFGLTPQGMDGGWMEGIQYGLCEFIVWDGKRLYFPIVGETCQIEGQRQ